MSATPRGGAAERRILATALAEELLAAIENAAIIPSLAARHAELDVALALEVRRALDARRRARGARALGRKIGFTNRSLWPLYGVDAPIWAHVWTDSVVTAEDGVATVSLAGLVQPRIEPEIALRLARPLAESCDDPVRVLESCDAYCHTLEIVQSHFPAWRFALADAVADQACHGRLVVGPWRPVEPAQREALAAALAAGEVSLWREDDVVERGRGANALGHPALAMGTYLADALGHEAAAPALAAGEIVTTGTLTDAHPVAPGEIWRTTWQGLDVAGLTLRLVP